MKMLGCALYIRCALSIGKYGNLFLVVKLIRKFDVCLADCSKLCVFSEV
jgi:hypothetical protein